MISLHLKITSFRSYEEESSDAGCVFMVDFLLSDADDLSEESACLDFGGNK